MDAGYSQITRWKHQCDDLIRKGYKDYSPTLDDQGQLLPAWSFMGLKWQNIEALEQRFTYFSFVADQMASALGQIEPRLLTMRKIQLAETVRPERYEAEAKKAEQDFNNKEAVQEQVSAFSSTTLESLAEQLEKTLNTPGAQILGAMDKLETFFNGLCDPASKVNLTSPEGKREFHSLLADIYGRISFTCFSRHGNTLPTTLEEEQQQLTLLKKVLNFYLIETENTKLPDFLNEQARSLHLPAVKDEMLNFLKTKEDSIKARITPCNPPQIPVAEAPGDEQTVKASQGAIPVDKMPFIAVTPANTPGFRNHNGVNCFANAALKQIIVGLAPEDLLNIQEAFVGKPSEQKDVMTSFLKLANAVIAQRTGHTVDTDVDTLQQTLLENLVLFGLLVDSHEARTMKTLLVEGGKSQQDSQAFAACLIDLLGLRDSTQELCRFETTCSLEDNRRRHHTGHSTLYYPITLKTGSSLVNCFEPESEVMDGDNKVEWEDKRITNENGIQVEHVTKTKLSSLKTASLGNPAPQDMRRIRIQAKLFDYDWARQKGLRSTKAAREFILNQTETRLPILNTETLNTEQVPFKIHSVVVHLGGESVDSGHYVTLEHQNNHWYLHDDRFVTELPNGIEGYLKEHPGAAPYLIDMVRNNTPSP
ncbi:ubiquitin carboxyl-terminal hydrolase [Endozoicomonas gorgoniicola]|uniref:Ubiquitin carboxyl-terminal hydrolase n=1 Tax=Endozoicomonas gorgoniicola TaxID=1234144 RepID=A0ABT3MQ10_9GAMM|nr:ubiquitin carboxyl-terminal hydrolase family protein [Endozoicomonas gorgoniicola]MCW7551460.1 ubiquitin carboxyl-terminal hydrolase [Endozoicomonas gorgoniicola]